MDDTSPWAAQKARLNAATRSGSATFSTVGDSKADALRTLAARIRSAEVPPMAVLTWERWRLRPRAALRYALHQLPVGELAVRSSRYGEDAVGADAAGRYRSMIGVPRARAAAAIDAVFASYGSPRGDDQVLLQNCVRDVQMAIVAANRAPGDGAPYDTISYAIGSDPAAITAGVAAAETYHLARRTAASSDPLLARVRAVLREIERRIYAQPFELELLLAQDRLWLLQWRPLAPGNVQSTDVVAARRRASRQLRQARKPAVRQLFGLMPDWNPAELLGEHPRPLARGLFDALIARDAWWQARTILGYCRPQRRNLIRVIGGRPYVDVRASFESLLPAQLGSACADEVVDRWIERLARDPALHDRVELEVAVTCAEFDAAARLRAGGLGTPLVRSMHEALRTLTRAAFVPLQLASRRNRAERLAAHRWEIPVGPVALREALCRLRTLAALPFAIDARLDFIGAALLHSAARRGAIDPQWPGALRATAGTTAGALLSAWQHGGVSALNDRLCDLRPGTFEIDVSPCDELPSASVTESPPLPVEALPSAQRIALNRLLREERLGFDAAELCRAAADAARARDIGKLALARGIAAVLAGIAAWGHRMGLDRSQLSWLDPRILCNPGIAPIAMQRAATIAAARHLQERGLRMPTLLEHDTDLRTVRCIAASPTFLGTRTVSGALHRVDRHTRPIDVPPGAVLAIESADPGFDWIFIRRPVALLTAFGGPQSHMALRCVEHGVAAVLGLGLSRFRRICNAGALRVDPQRHAIDVIATQG